jgi:hypothetical protein
LQPFPVITVGVARIKDGSVVVTMPEEGSK